MVAESDVVKPRRSWRADQLTLPHANSGLNEDEVDQDELDARFEETTQRQGWSFNSLFMLCFPAAAAPCVLVIVLWSDMGAGRTVYELLGHFHVLSYLLGGLVALLLSGLYLLDFWLPPHLPGQFCALFDGDVRFGPAILAAVGLISMAAGFSSAKQNPTVPPVMTALIGPVLMAAIRKATQVSDNVQTQDFSRGVIHAKSGVVRLTEAQKLDFLGRFLAGTADDARTFYAAAMSGFFMSGVTTALIWFGWVLSVEALPDTGRPAETFDVTSDQGAYLRWCIPGLVAFFNLGLAMIISLRVKLADSYRAAIRAEHSEKSEEAVDARKAHMMRLGTYTKVVNCLAFVLLGSTKAAVELQAVESHSANLMLMFIGVFVIAYYLFMFVTFKRVQSAIQEWLMDLPIWRMMSSLSTNDWVRAAFLNGTFPLLPFLVMLSAVNQLVRKMRGLYADIPQHPREFNPLVVPPTEPNSYKVQIQVDPVPDDQVLTERFVRLSNKTDSWDWVGIYEKMTLLAIAMSGSTLSTKFLNIFLSWLVSVLQPLPLASLLVAAFVAGLICFLLPPVPGVPVYLFTGVLIAAKSNEFGFWTCCGIAVGLSFFMKLFACAIQQKMIGGFLGSSRRIRSLVGVQKPLIRAIEVVLRSKGFSIPKIAIACGGPDWPTSVLAGVLGLPLLEMELVTLPVIFFLAPCVLSGAFFLKRGEGPMWESMANLMLQVTVVAALVLQLIAAWAIQEVLDKKNRDVTIPLEQTVELDWLDHAAEKVKEASYTPYNRLNILARVCLFWGMLIQVMVAHVLFWQGSACFGQFAVTDDINTLQVFNGQDAFIKPTGAFTLAIMCIGFVIYLTFRVMQDFARRSKGQKRMKELDAQKDEWVTFRKLLARQAVYNFPYTPPPVPGVYMKNEF